MNKSVMIGCDPEFFILDKNKNVVPSTAIIDDEVIVRGRKNGASAFSNVGTIVKDGFQVELHPAPETCRAWLKDNLFFLLKTTDELAADKGFTLSREFVVDVTKKMLDSLSSEVVALGCAPDYSAYSGEIKVLQLDASNHFKRYAGGHIHIGTLDNGNRGFYENQIKTLHFFANDAIRLMDYILGTIMTIIDTDKNNAERRKIYGQAGSYRIQPHGIEYRTLSNFWMTHPSLVTLATGLARFCVHHIFPYADGGEDDILYALDKEFKDMKDIRNAINNSDNEHAIENLNRILKVLSGKRSYYDLMGYISYSNLEKFVNISLNPELSPFNKSIQENWKLDTIKTAYKTHDETLPDFTRFMDNFQIEIKKKLKYKS